MPLLDDVFGGGNVGTFQVHGTGIDNAGSAPDPIIDCYDVAEIVDPTHPVMAGLSDSQLSGWFCSAHEPFTMLPLADWDVLTIVTDTTSPPPPPPPPPAGGRVPFVRGPL